MKKNFVKKLALGLALVMAVTSVPATSEAAAKPGFKSTKVTVKEGQTKKYNTKNASKYSVKFKIGNKSVATIKYSAGSKAVKVTGVAEGKTTLRADFKSYKTKKVTTVKIPVTVKALNPEVKQASASGSTTVVLGGIKLDKYVATDFTVDGNTVVAYTAAADGKTATLTLGAALVPDVKYTLKVGTASFEIVYKLDATTVAVTEATYDNDTAFQSVAFSVNGQKGSIDDLAVNGYTVSFKAVDVLGNDKTTVLFADPSTGMLKTNLQGLEGLYKVQITLIKGSSIVVSEQAKVTIADLDFVAKDVKSYAFTAGATGTEHYLNSTTLVVGEKAELVKFGYTVNNGEVVLGGVAMESGLTTDVTTDESDCDAVAIESSNPAVVSVDTKANGYTLSANGPGTATITMTYGNAKKVLNFTVTATARKLTRVVATPVTKTVIASKPADTTTMLVAVDQYGDPVNGVTLVANATDGTVATTGVVSGSTNPLGWEFVSIVGNRAGSTSVTFVEAGKNTTLGSMNVKVTTVDNLGSSKLELYRPAYALYESKDAVLETELDYSVSFKLNQYTTEGVKRGSVNLGGSGYSVKYNPNVVEIGTGVATGTYTTDIAAVILNTDAQTATGAAISAGTANLHVIAKAVGTTNVVVYNGNGVAVASVTITVKDTQPTITGVTTKAVSTVNTTLATINYKTILNSVTTAGDAKLSGVSVSVANGNPVYLRTTVDDGMIYIDNNGNATYDAAKDYIVGYVKAELLTGSSATITGGTIGTPVATVDAGFKTTTLGEKGTVLFRFYGWNDDVNNLGYNKVLKTVAVTIDVTNN